MMKANTARGIAHDSTATGRVVRRPVKVPHHLGTIGYLSTRLRKRVVPQTAILARAVLSTGWLSPTTRRRKKT